MKKIALLLSFTFIFQVSYCQNFSKSEYTTQNPALIYGLKTSFNLVNFNGHHFRKIQPGFSVGAWARKPVARRLALQAELLFCKKGFAIPYNYPLIGLNTMRNNLYYLNLNLLLRYKFLKRNGLYFGLGADRLLFNNAKFTEPFPDNVSVGKITFNDPNRMPLSFTIGTFYKINELFSIDLRYRRTVYSITDPHSIRCNFIALGIEYKLDI